MTALPSVRGKDLVAAMKKAGFEVVRVKGSHHFLRHQDGRDFFPRFFATASWLAKSFRSFSSGQRLSRPIACCETNG